jgi:hypothetical protein
MSLLISSILFQFAGDIGKYSFGVEKEFNSTYSLSAFYGFVPANGIQDKIETYTIKNTFNLFHFSYKKINYTFYTGLGIFHVPGKKYQTNNIDDAPNDYYRQSSLRGLVYIGHDFEYSNKASMYLETGINDIWLINSSNNSSVDYKDHLSLGIGFRYNL